VTLRALVVGREIIVIAEPAGRVVTGRVRHVLRVEAHGPREFRVYVGRRLDTVTPTEGGAVRIRIGRVVHVASVFQRDRGALGLARNASRKLSAQVSRGERCPKMDDPYVT